jgi:5-methylcytosine-specific restriction endonuclease McrA
MPADARFSRTDPRAGHVVGGVTACRECGAERPAKARWRTFCSAACVHEWKLRSQPGYAGDLVLARDKGVCAACGLDCVQLRRELVETAVSAGHEVEITTAILRAGPYAERCRELGLTGERARLRRRLWEVDHVVAVVEGGGCCGLDNLQTLCWRCHARATAELAARRAQRKREAQHA